MALRGAFACIPAAALVVFTLTACNDKKDAPKNPATAADLNRRCESLSVVCGEKDKHTDRIVEECTQAAKQQVEKGCIDKAIALYDCYEKDVCGKGDKVWTLRDIGVLAERYKKCEAARKASDECVAK